VLSLVSKLSIVYNIEVGLSHAPIRNIYLITRASGLKDRVVVSNALKCCNVRKLMYDVMMIVFLISPVNIFHHPLDHRRY
jgi:hypothetical protein